MQLSPISALVGQFIAKLPTISFFRIFILSYKRLNFWSIIFQLKPPQMPYQEHNSGRPESSETLSSTFSRVKIKTNAIRVRASEIKGRRYISQIYRCVL